MSAQPPTAGHRITSTADRTDRTDARRRRRRTAAVLSLVAALLGSSLAGVVVDITVGVVADPFVPSAQAAGTPDIVLTKTTETEVLIGATTTVTLRACNPASQPDGYNLSFRDVVPSGASFVSGTPAPSRTVANLPLAGETTLIWENVSDLLTGTCSSISYTIDTNPDGNLATLRMGSTFATTGGAYVNTNAFFIPDFDSNGQPATDITGSDTDTPAITTISAFVAEKVAGNVGEGELLRGVHGARPVTYTVRVRNNPDAPTNDLTLVDVLPPSLEFLGCAYVGGVPGYSAGTDNTIDAPTNETPGAQTDEYVGSGRLAIGSATATCRRPSLIDTVGGSTHVTWTAADLGAAGDLAAGATLEITYLAGIPLRANTDTWPNGRPSASSLGQGRNLDNNSGPPTSETAAEPAVTNQLTATGTFIGPSTLGANPTINDSATATVTSEDLVVRKSASGQVVQGSVVTSTLVIQTGEYRTARDLVVVDTLPDGLCPLETTAWSVDCGTDAAATIDAGSGPQPAPFTAVENADGTWTLTWSHTAVPELQALPHDGTVTIVFRSRVRTHYFQNGAIEPGRPILNFDRLVNNVSISGLDDRRTVIDATTGDPEPDGVADNDVSSAAIDGIGPSIDKRVSARDGVLASGSFSNAGTGNAGDIGDACRDGSFTWVDNTTGFRPGDYVCFSLRATFPGNIDADAVQIVDMLPAKFDYVPGSARRVTGGGSPDDLANTTVTTNLSGANDTITFDVEGNSQVPSAPGGRTFHWTIAARVGDPTLSAAYDINANLMKMTTTNTAGDVFQYRDQSDLQWTEPQVKLDKTNGATGNVDGGDDVVYTIRLWNDGNVAAANAVVWDRLPTGITCADVTTSTPTATCSSNVLEWDAADIPSVAGPTTLGSAPVTLTYTVNLPDSVDPGRQYTNTAGVRTYQAATNATDSPQVYVPANNIDPTLTATNADQARDTSVITVVAATAAKTQQSSVNDAPSNPANASPGTGAETVTIGETITYTITATIPEGTSVLDARVTDALDDDLVLAATPTWVFDGVANDPAWSLHVSTPAVGANGTIRLDRTGTHTNAAGSGDDLLVLTIVARTSNAGTTVAGDAISNQGVFSYLPAPVIGTTRVDRSSNTVNATVREPNPTITKNENDADDIVSPSDTLTYTLTINNAGANVVRAHDLVIVDTLPVGVTVVNSGVAVVDGGTVAPDGGTWNATNRTITWNATTTPGKLASVAASGSTSLTYDVRIDNPAVSGAIFTNNVTLAASSLAGTATGERTTYASNATDTVTGPSASIAKSVSPSTATIGDTVTFTLDTTIPAGITVFDATILDTLGDGLDFLTFGGFSYVPATSAGCPSLAGAQGIAGQTANLDGSTTIGLWIDELTAPSANSCVVRATYNARLDSVYEPENTAVPGNATLSNSARIHWNNSGSIATAPATPPAAGSFARGSNLVTATVTVREPSIRIDKDVSQTPCDQTPGNTGDNDTCQTDVGSSHTYTLRITNQSTTWPAHDIVVVDAPDADLVNVVVPASAGAVTVVDGTAPNLEWLISTIAPNSSVTITYTADLAGSATLNDGEQVTNTADVTEYWAQPLATRVGDLAAEWRVYGQGGAGGDVAADTVTMTVGFPNVTVVKSALDDATDARAGVDFTWRIVATNQLAEPTAPAFGVDLSDVLPAGWVYATGTATVVTPYGSASVEPVCTPSCATPGATLRWNDVVTGSLQPLNPGANVTVTFDATPQSSLLTVGTTGTFDHVNTAGVPDAEDVTGATSNLDGDYTGPDDTESARIRRSDLSVTKTVTAGPYSFGSEVNWTITVANAGPDTATGVTVADILPASLVFVSTVSSTQGTYSSSTGIWTVGSVANGASQTLVIRTRLNVIGPITNRAEVQASNQWDLDSTPAAVTAVTNEDDDDTVTISASSTSLGDLVWYDIDGDGTADVGEPGIPGVRVRLESEGLDGTFGTTDDFLGPDGVPGGGDDIPVTEVLTNATGFYGFLDLPTGDYRVVIDTTTLPAGMANTFDDDGNEDSRSGIVTLTSSTGYLGADFGYTGTGSIGDTIWLDRDASGGATRQAGEPGIGGIDLTLMWGGFDGDLATTSDNVTHPVDTTDAGGQYLFDLLPAGPYRLTVDTADLLAGTTWSYDLDGIGTPAAITTSLTAGQDRADVDLSLAGTGSIGDRVWLDHDSDGVLDGSETGLGGIDVTVTWFGPNGVLGGGDDVVTTTTTDAGGLYLVDHLPAGAYRVTVDTADLPVGVGPTFDLDGTGTANTTALTLGSAQDRVDADFGYSGLASIGDRLWFDIDGDGADAPEPGDTPLAGVPLTITWSGPDTIVGTSDDVAITTATDATGSYLVGSLPNGPVRVAVDISGLPGFTSTYDGDGLVTLHTVTITLTDDDPGTAGIDEANRRDADTAFTGTGSIGDQLWIDADADGVLDGGETGLAGIDVTVRWAGLDGVAGTADDVVFTTTTGSDGRYLVERLPAGAYTVIVDTADLPAGLVNVADPDPTRDSRTSTTLVAGQNRTDMDFGYQFQADLSLQKSHGARFEVGTNGVYTIAVTNAGPAAATTPRVTDVLPAGLTYVSGTGTGIACAAVGQTVTCNLPTLAVNGTSTITLTVAVGRAAAPSVVNTASVTSPTFDPVPANNTDSDPTEVPLADLDITKRLDGTLANPTALYVLEATNLGPSPSGGPLVITDNLPAGLEFLSATSTNATCSAEGQLVTCRSTTAIRVGGRVTVELRVLVTATTGSQLVNSAQVSSESMTGSLPPTDPVTSNNTAATAATIVTAGLPATGAALLQQWLQLATWALGLGALALHLARRRLTDRRLTRPTDGAG
ncbi:MAG: DUF11 domain-containing protein [Actinobacteria bacterium]|uniref:Unannotated protein n=1 Tax=freshwater metagenome TaxID=449393 RepID=A0A6J6EA88_9ZZZZ|nr:DUF11 domain-containing protein [Actinomycetota bacterium]